MTRRTKPARHGGASLCALALTGAAVLATSPALAAEARRETFGELAGRPVEAVVLTNAHGLKARILAYGAALQSLEVPDRTGHLDDVVLG